MWLAGWLAVALTESVWVGGCISKCVSERMALVKSIAVKWEEKRDWQHECAFTPVHARLAITLSLARCLSKALDFVA